MTFPLSGGGGGSSRVWLGSCRSLWVGRLELLPDGGLPWSWSSRLQCRAPIGCTGVGVSLQLPAPLLGYTSGSAERAPSPGLITVSAAPILDDSDYDHTMVYPVSPEQDEYPLLETVDAPAGSFAYAALQIAHQGLEDLYLAHRVDATEPLFVSKSVVSVGNPVGRLDLYRSGVYRVMAFWESPILTNAVHVVIRLTSGDLVRIGDLTRQPDEGWSASSRVPALVRVVGVGV